MWAKSVNIRAREEDFSRKMAKMYEDMNRQKATNEQQNQPNKHGLSQAPSQGASNLATKPPAYAAAHIGSGLTKNVGISHEQVTPSTHSAISPGPRSPDLAAPSAHQPQHTAFGVVQGYPPPGAWAGYYPHTEGYAQPPPVNSAGPPPMAPQSYQPWQTDPRYLQYPMQPTHASPQQQGGPAGLYPPPPPTAAGAAPS